MTKKIVFTFSTASEMSSRSGSGIHKLTGLRNINSAIMIVHATVDKRFALCIACCCSYTCIICGNENIEIFRINSNNITYMGANFYNAFHWLVTKKSTVNCGCNFIIVVAVLYVLAAIL